MSDNSSKSTKKKKHKETKLEKEDEHEPAKLLSLRERLPNLDVSTILVHADDEVENLPDLAPPIHVSTTYREDNPEGMVYSRYEQKTRSRVEAVLGELEGGKALVYSSGVAAVLSALMFYKPKRIFINEGYKGTHSVLQTYLSQFESGAEPWYSRIKKLEKESISTITSSDIIWLETPKNPTCEIQDIKFYAEAATKANARVVVDSTFASPILQKPLKLGANMVMHSCTKFLAGQSDVLGGALIVSDTAVYAKLQSQRTTLGMVMGNLENFLLLRSLRTLQLRVLRQSKTATAIATFLDTKRPLVDQVYHPSLPSHPQHQLCKEQMSGFPPILSFELNSAAEAKLFTSKLLLITPATSLGGVHSTIDWRYKFDSTLPPGLLRLSVGLESKKDLIEDIKNALSFLKQ